MGSLVKANRFFLQKLRSRLQRRLVSTTKKNNDTVAADICNNTTSKAETKNWISYGFSYNTKGEDRTALHSVLFASITLCVAVGGFFYTYAPDMALRDWAVREAFLELRRREAAGLPLVDPNFIPVENIILPSDEDLGDTEVII